MGIIQRSIDLNGNPGIAQLVVAIIFGLLATISVVLRFVSRRNFDAGPGFNHQYALRDLANSTSRLIISGVVAGGSGLSKHRLNDSELRIFWKSMFVTIVSWPIAQSFTKISILLFYIQLFPTKWFTYSAYSLIAAVSAWMIQQVLASLLLCRPISFNWDASVNGTCGNVAANCLAGAGINTLTDILILILPMPIIWRLQVPLRNKIILSLIFGLGSLICIISIIRLKVLFSYTTAPMTGPPFNSDGPRDNGLSILYTVVEVCLGVICACLIIMKPIFTNSKFFNSVSRKFSSWSSSSAGSSDATKRIASWGPSRAVAAQQDTRARGMDMGILKTCEIDVELEAAMVAEGRRGQGMGHTPVYTDKRRDGHSMAGERSASEVTMSTSSRDRVSETRGV
ncbi:MAG: hypothetical protein Q9168_003655 [Polycauliona sp. 1 TL-2023]